MSVRSGPTEAGLPDSEPLERTARRTPQRQAAGRMGRNVLWTISGNLFPPAAMLITAPLLARALGVLERGQVSAATAPLLLATTAATLGVPQAINYVVARSPGLTRRVTHTGFALIVAAGLGAMAAILLATPVLSGHDARIQSLMLVATLAILPNLLIAVLRGTASGMHKWKAVAIERFLSAAARLVATIVLFATQSLTPLSATIVIAAGPLVGVAAYFKIYRNASEAHYVGAEQEARPRFIVSYGVRIWVGAVFGILLTRMDQVLMTPLSSAFELGLYAVAANVSEVSLVVNNSVRAVVFSTDAAASDDRRLQSAARISGTCSAAVGLLIAVTMPFWLPALFGQEFSGAIPVTAVLIVGIVLGTPGSIAGAGLSSRGRPGLRSAGLAIACVINVGCLFWAVPMFGAMGGAIATTIGNLISSSLGVYFLWRYFEISPWRLYGLRRDDITVLASYARSLRAQFGRRRRRVAL